MSDYNEKLSQLQQRLDKMVEYQNYFNREISLIRNEINALKQQSQPNEVKAPPIVSQPPRPSFERPQITPPLNRNQAKPSNQPLSPVINKSNLEELIGKNIISIIGIIITIIGVGIGAKYAIDRNLISPTMRIFLGYIFAFILLGFAFKLKEKYDKFSAVLLSGAVAILYFLTYFAYNFYGLISQTPAFIIMVSVTVFTVYSAWQYNRQVIGAIGLVGAYAIPFLLSNETGNVLVLFSYISLINIGILTVSIRKYWNFLSISAFVISWLIFSVWFGDQYVYSRHFTLAMTFAAVFFAIFYTSFIVYKLYHKREFSFSNAVLVSANSLIYLFLGLIILSENSQTKQFFGFFALANGILHYGVSYLIAERLHSRKTLYFILGLTLFFLTIAVPIQSEGFWTPVFWTIEAVFLFWVGYTKQIKFYEAAAYILMFLATCGIFVYLSDNQVNWTSYYYDNPNIDKILTLTPFYNKPFLTGSVFVVGFGIICYLLSLKKYQTTIDLNLFKLIKIGISAVFLIAIYNLFRTEIGNYWHLQYVQTAYLESIQYYQTLENRLVFDKNLTLFNIIWQINYSMLFLAILSFINAKLLKNVGLGFSILPLNGIVLIVFSTIGLYILSNLRESYLLQTDAENFVRGISHVLIRYISLSFAVGLIIAAYQLYKKDFLQNVADIKVIFDLVIGFVVWLILSSELLNLMDIYGINDSYKLALSLLWGSYSLLLIILGILWRKTHLRIGAISLFALTLIKLFFYDLSSLGTIAKTIVFVSLGIMLLIISFLYNKYKNLLFHDGETVG